MIILELFLTFMKIGAFTFGGGYAMLPLIQAEVTARGWIEVAALVDFIAISESTPGPFAINMATFVGVTKGGISGAAAATLGVVLPSFVIIIIVAKFYERFRKSRAVSGIMRGLKPAVVGMIGAALVSLLRTVFFAEGVSTAVLAKPDFWVFSALFAIMSFLAFRKLHPIIIILISAAIGVAAGFVIGL